MFNSVALIVIPILAAAVFTAAVSVIAIAYKTPARLRRDLEHDLALITLLPEDEQSELRSSLENRAKQIQVWAMYPYLDAVDVVRLVVVMALSALGYFAASQSLAVIARNGDGVMAYLFLPILGPAAFLYLATMNRVSDRSAERSGQITPLLASQYERRLFAYVGEIGRIAWFLGGIVMVSGPILQSVFKITAVA